MTYYLGVSLHYIKYWTSVAEKSCMNIVTYTEWTNSFHVIDW